MGDPCTLLRVVLGAGRGGSHPEPSQVLFPLSRLMEDGDWEEFSLQPGLGLRAGNPLWGDGEVGFRQVERV